MAFAERIKNAYSYGGIKEIIRKSFFLVIYKIGGIHTYLTVVNTPQQYGVTKKKRKRKIIVSLTSFPPRFKDLDLCLRSLTQQKLKPDKIIVYLGNDTKESDILKSMRKYEDSGIEFRIDNAKNLMPHKKYYYAMQEFPNDIIVTADDDVIYPHNWLSSLVQSYVKYPYAVSSRRVHHITKRNGHMEQYDHWIDQCRTIRKPSMELIATGNGGVLYPPHCLSKEAFNVDNIEKLCIRTDDIWLKCMEVRNNTPVVWVENWKVKPRTIDSSKNKRLSDENIFTGNNDLVLKKVMETYSLTEDMFFDKK